MSVYQFTMLFTHNSILTSYSHYQLDITVYILDVEESNMIMFCPCIYVVPFVVSLSMV